MHLLVELTTLLACAGADVALDEQNDSESFADLSEAAISDDAPEVPPTAACAPWPAPPFDAWVTVDTANIRREPRRGANVIGLLHRGDSIRVVDCEPECNAPAAWGLLEDAGAIRLDTLQQAPVEDGFRRAEQNYFHARVKTPWTRVYVLPTTRSYVMARYRKGTMLALVDDDTVRPGWWRHASGGYVRASQLTAPRPSALRGEEEPAGTLAFLKRTVVLPARGGALRRIFPHHARVRALGLTRRGDVMVEGGVLPRDAVALAFHRPRPESLRDDDAWVHVDLQEQVLTAYEGDRWVYATMIRTGRRSSPTKPGLFRVWAKIHHSTMSGGGRRPYRVEEVPHILAFNREQALHGAFWHDGFGTPGSHGCINLSPHDARWIFEWAPPRMPAGWHTVVTRHAGLGNLWVMVERAGPGTFDVEPRPGVDNPCACSRVEAVEDRVIALSDEGQCVVEEETLQAEVTHALSSHAVALAWSHDVNREAR
ncbi:MAG: L,D-transpeptidase [Myxococcota bacterium]